jgi:hypothetical protein
MCLLKIQFTQYSYDDLAVGLGVLPFRGIMWNINVPAETQNPSKVQYITNTFLQFVPVTI